MVQTPQQRQSNIKFAKQNTAKMGKPVTAVKQKSKDFKSPVSPMWLGLLAFVVFGGLVFEALSRIFFK